MFSRFDLVLSKFGLGLRVQGSGLRSFLRGRSRGLKLFWGLGGLRVLKGFMLDLQPNPKP